MYVVNDCGILKEEGIKIIKDFYINKNSINFNKVVCINYGR